MILREGYIALSSKTCFDRNFCHLQFHFAIKISFSLHFAMELQHIYTISKCNGNCFAIFWLWLWLLCKRYMFRITSWSIHVIMILILIPYIKCYFEKFCILLWEQRRCYSLFCSFLPLVPDWANYLYHLNQIRELLSSWLKWNWRNNLEFLHSAILTYKWFLNQHTDNYM